MVLELANIHLKNFKHLLPEGIRELLKDVDVHLNKTDLEVTGQLDNPTYKFTLDLDQVISKNKHIGALIADLKYSNQNLNGNITLKNENYGLLPPLDLEIIKFPIDLGLNKNFGKINGDYLAKMSMDSLNLQIVESFQPYLKNIKGTANAEITVSGTNEKDYKINGYLNSSDLSFKFMQNNLDYSMKTKLTFDNQKVKIDTLTLVNFGMKSYARVNGLVEFENNKLTEYNLGLNAENYTL
jgi:autotransporter translocation and assembly factor TamB